MIHNDSTSDSPLVGQVTEKKITNTITYHSSPISSASVPTLASEPWPPRPLLLLLPWLGFRPVAVQKYREVYFRHGFDVLTVESKVSHFLWPRSGLSYALELLDLLSAKPYASRPLFVHAFSVGGFMFSQLLLHMVRDPWHYQQVGERIQGQVFDSLVIGSLETMATGVARMMFPPRWESLAKRCTMLYFNTFKSYTVDYYDTSIKVFWDNPVKSPALFYYCKDDPLSDHLVVEDLVRTWRDNGVSVVGKSWENSRHAGHFRQHPQEYLNALENHLQCTNMAPIVSKL
uniref:Si:dkey-5i3.5 n=2 Tax=Latimeria chalumnae TaxID=7897 RepID=H2ZWL4_LATCH